MRLDGDVWYLEPSSQSFTSEVVLPSALAPGSVLRVIKVRSIDHRVIMSVIHVRQNQTPVLLSTNKKVCWNASYFSSQRLKYYKNYRYSIDDEKSKKIEQRNFRCLFGIIEILKLVKRDLDGVEIVDWLRLTVSCRSTILRECTTSKNALVSMCSLTWCVMPTEIHIDLQKSAQ